MQSTVVETAMAPTCPWIEFTYKKETRTGCHLKTTYQDDGALLLCKTERGFRSFKGSKMTDVVNVSTVVA